MKYAITVDGTHKALVDIDLGQKDFIGDQPFTGKITSDESGPCIIENGMVQPGSGLLTGKVTLHGVDGQFSAKIDGKNISGQITYRFVFTRHAAFEGVETT